MIPADQLKFEVARVVDAARVGGYPAALRVYKEIAVALALETKDLMIFGYAIQGGLRDAGIGIQEPNAR